MNDDRCSKARIQKVVALCLVLAALGYAVSELVASSWRLAPLAELTAERLRELYPNARSVLVTFDYPLSGQGGSSNSAGPYLALLDYVLTQWPADAFLWPPFVQQAHLNDAQQQPLALLFGGADPGYFDFVVAATAANERAQLEALPRRDHLNPARRLPDDRVAVLRPLCPSPRLYPRCTAASQLGADAWPSDNHAYDVMLPPRPDPDVSVVVVLFRDRDFSYRPFRYQAPGVAPLLRQRYWSALPPHWSSRHLPAARYNVVMHVRAGDIIDIEDDAVLADRRCVGPVTRWRRDQPWGNKFLAAPYYFAAVDALAPLLAPGNATVRLLLVSEPPASFEVLEIQRWCREHAPHLELALFLGGVDDAAETFHVMTHADLLVASFSGFSRLAAVLNPHAVVLAPLLDYIPVDGLPNVHNVVCQPSGQWRVDLPDSAAARIQAAVAEKSRPRHSHR